MNNQKSTNLLPKLVFSLFFAITFLLLLNDSFFNPSSSIKYFSVDSRFLYTIFVISYVALRLFNKQLLFNTHILINKKIIFPIFALVFVVLAIVGSFTYQNFIFSVFRLNLEIFKYLFYLSGFVFLANLKVDWLNTFKQRLLYYGGIMVSLFVSLYSALYLESFKYLLREDGFFETTQTILYFMGGIISLAVARIYLKKSKKIFAVFFLCLSLFLFFVTGEEISWGQRIFHLTTPPALAKVNLQGEMTIHNIRIFQVEIDYIYMVVGFWGAFGWYFAKRFFPKFFKKYYLFFPHPIIFFYFFAVSRYYFLNKFVAFNYQLFSFEKMGIGDRQEFPETFLAFGFFCYALLSYKLAKNKP